MFSAHTNFEYSWVLVENNMFVCAEILKRLQEVTVEKNILF